MILQIKISTIILALFLSFCLTFAQAATDIIAPTGSVSVEISFGEVSGDKVWIDVSTQDDDSLVKDVCLWLGDGANNLIVPAMCKTLAERNQYSYDYAASFDFYLDSTAIADGTYNLYAIATDNAGNIGTLGPRSMTINNVSLGSSVMPVPVTTCLEFQNIKDQGGWYYDIKNDIDCAETKNWNGGQGFMPIPSFGGVLNGYNFNINDLYMNITNLNNSDHGGVFDSNSGTIENLNLRNVDLSAAGYMGGMTSQNYGIIRKSSVTGKINCGSQTCGVMAGSHSGTISECWTDVDIVGGVYIGGIVGSSSGQVENCYAKGKVTANRDSSGAIGINQSTLLNSYSVGKINEGSSNGGLIGWQFYPGTQSGSYWNTETSGLDRMCNTLGATNCDDANGLTDVQMRDKDNFIGWDFVNIWRIDPLKNDGYPYLAWQTSFTEKKDFSWPIFLPAIQSGIKQP